jgi:hypothetical protein
MKMTVRVDNTDYVVEQAESPPYAMTIDGNPLTQLDATTMDRYALETKILTIDGRVRTRAQDRFNRRLREGATR